MPEAKEHCVWCGLSARGRGLMVGIVSSLALHLCVFTLINKPKVRTEPHARVIDMGEFTIQVPQAKKVNTRGVEL